MTPEPGPSHDRAVRSWLTRLDPSSQKFFANRIKGTTTIVEGGHDTLIAFPNQVAAAIEAASRGAKL